MRKTIAICLFLIGALPLAAQTPPPALKLPRASQHATITQTVGLTDIAIDYSRPVAKGRAIFGGLVPYDKVWRTGANDATTITFSDDVTINGQALPEGRLFAAHDSGEGLLDDHLQQGRQAVGLVQLRPGAGRAARDCQAAEGTVRRGLHDRHS